MADSGDTEVEKKSVHVHMVLAPSEVQAIDDWSFENKVRGRTEAVRRLCQMGLAFTAESPELVVQQEALSDGIAAVDAAFDSDDTENSAVWTKRLFDAVDSLVDAAWALSSGVMVVQATGDYLASPNPKAVERAVLVRQRFKDAMTKALEGKPFPDRIDDTPDPDDKP